MSSVTVREGFLDSEAINELDNFSECVYHRLLLAVDQAGRLDGRPPVVSSQIYPLKRTVREKDVGQALQKLCDAGLIILYSVNGKPYLQVTRWVKTGSMKQSKYPWKDGQYTLKYVKLPMCCEAGERTFVLSSVEHLMVHLLDFHVKPPEKPRSDPGRTPVGPLLHSKEVVGNNKWERSRSRCTPPPPPDETDLGKLAQEIRGIRQEFADIPLQGLVDALSNCGSQPARRSAVDDFKRDMANRQKSKLPADPVKLLAGYIKAASGGKQSGSNPYQKQARQQKAELQAFEEATARLQGKNKEQMWEIICEYTDKISGLQLQSLKEIYERTTEN